jgi:hypothetical protein
MYAITDDHAMSGSYQAEQSTPNLLLYAKTMLNARSRIFRAHLSAAIID